MPGDFDDSEPTAYERRVADSAKTLQSTGAVSEAVPCQQPAPVSTPDLVEAYRRLRHFRSYARGEQAVNVGLRARHIDALLRDAQPHRFSEPNL